MGINYLKQYKDGSVVATADKPVWGLGNKRDVAGYNPDVFVDGKWWNSSNGTELVTNGTFDTDVSGWTGGSWSNGTLLLDSNTTTYQNIICVIGGRYKLKYSFSNNDLTRNFFVYINNTRIANITGEDGSYEYEFTAETVSVEVKFIYNYDTAGDYANIDNISVFETEIQPDTEYPTQFTYLNQDGKLLGVEVADGQPVDLHLTEDAPSLVEKCIKSDVVIANEFKGKTINLSELPTVDPYIYGELWNSSNTVKISAGV